MKYRLLLPLLLIGAPLITAYPSPVLYPAPAPIYYPVPTPVVTYTGLSFISGRKLSGNYILLPMVL